MFIFIQISASVTDDNSTNLTKSDFFYPDLLIGQINVPEYGSQGFDAQGTVDIINAGPGDASDVRIEFLLVPEKDNTTEIWVHGKTAEEIPGLYHETIPFEIEIPDGIPAGDYRLKVEIITNNDVNDENNSAISQVIMDIRNNINFKETTRPSLSIRIDSISNLELYPGNLFTVNYTVINNGGGQTGTFYVGLYLSDDSSIEPTDRLIGSYVYYKAWPHMNEEGTATILIPYGIPAGDYYLGAIVDYTSKISESNENENSCYYPQVITMEKAGVVVTQKVLDDITGYLTIKTNLYREHEGLPALKYDVPLGKIATAHSNDMAVRGYFSHYTPEGLTPGDRAEINGYTTMKSLKDGTVRTGIAENILKIPSGYSIGKSYIGFVDPVSTEDTADTMLIEWIGSPEHQINLVNKDVTNIGIGVAFDGEYFYATQDFY